MATTNDTDQPAPALRGWQRLLAEISAMAGSPWGNPGGGDDKGGDKGSDKGGGPRNPWTQPIEDRGPRGPKARGPSALDELLKRGRGSGGGGGGGFGRGLPPMPSAKLWSWGILGFLGLWVVFSSFHIVPPEKEGVVTRLGSYSRTVPAGVQVTWPAPIERIVQLDVRQIRTMDIGSPDAADKNFVLTRDQSIIDLAYGVRWTISDPELYMFQLSDPDGTIREVAESSMRATVANFDLVQAIGPGRVDIETQVQARMQELLNRYRAGVRIEGVAIRQADPPSQVDDAFKAVTAARQERESAINLARAYEQQVLERARGDTSAFDKIYEQYRLAPGVTRQRLYYETMENVLSNVDKTIVEPRGVNSYLPLSEAQRRAVPPAAATKGGQ